LAEAEKELKKVYSELVNILESAKAAGDKLSGTAKKELTDLLAKAGDTKEKLRAMLSAIHQGDADDKDLQQAIKDANTAIDHIKDYLKK